MPKQRKAKNAEPATQPAPAATPKGKSVISHERKQAWLARPADRLDAALADVLLSADHSLLSVCHENQLADRWNTKWSRLNPGMQRMNLANVLRGRIRREERVTVAGAEIR